MLQSIFYLWLFYVPLPKNSAILVDDLPIHEAMEQVSLCNTFPFSYHGKAEAFIPFGYRQVFETKKTPLLNIVRVFKKNKTLVLVFRGTVTETNSWLENLHFMQIPAKDSLRIDGTVFKYCFSEKKHAQIHSGYALGIQYLWLELHAFLMNELNKGIYKIVCTGHSQGGALAQLFMAQLDLDSDFQDVHLINYSFGSPMVGNQDFADDFNARFTRNNRSFRFINKEDVVCMLPLNNHRFEFDYLGYQSQIDLETAAFWLQLGKEFLPEKYKSKVDRTLSETRALADKIMKEQVGDIEFPEFSGNVFYTPTGKIIALDAQPYPDWMNLPEDEQLSGWMGYVINKKHAFSRELTFFQHHIFNYYRAIDTHFPMNGFRKVRLRTLSEAYL